MNYSYKIRWLEKKSEQARLWLLSQLTRSGAEVFTKTGDVISPRPRIRKAHEPALEAFIRESAAEGYSDFFIDIGANIGLTSCFVGSCFKQLALYEPNPICAAVATANVLATFESDRANIFTAGLGDRRMSATLKIPKHNWGGAFIERGNNYSSQTLARKDGFTKLDPKNYRDVQVEILEAGQEIKRLLSTKPFTGLNSGVIKIDAEGYEISILSALANHLPSNKRYLLVFESMRKDLDLSSIFRPFPFKTAFFKLSRLDQWKNLEIPIWRRLFRRDTEYVLINPVADTSGDIVIFLEPLPPQFD